MVVQLVNVCLCYKPHLHPTSRPMYLYCKSRLDDISKSMSSYKGKREEMERERQRQREEVDRDREKRWRERDRKKSWREMNCNKSGWKSAGWGWGAGGRRWEEKRNQEKICRLHWLHWWLEKVSQANRGALSRTKFDKMEKETSLFLFLKRWTGPILGRHGTLEASPSLH